MNIPDQLITDINNITPSLYLKKQTREFLVNNLKFIKTHASPDENKQITPIIKILTNNIDADNKKT